MKTIPWALKSVTLGAAILGLSFGAGWAAMEEEAQAPPAAAEQQPANPELLKEVIGKIANVNSQERQLSIKTGLFGSTHFLVDWNTVISQGNKRLRLTDLSAGDQVEVQYASQGGRNIARLISVVQSRGEKPGTERQG